MAVLLVSKTFVKTFPNMEKSCIQIAQVFFFKFMKVLAHPAFLFQNFLHSTFTKLLTSYYKLLPNNRHHLNTKCLTSLTQRAILGMSHFSFSPFQIVLLFHSLFILWNGCISKSQKLEVSNVTNIGQYLDSVFDLNVCVCVVHCCRLKSPFHVQLQENTFTLTW